jgi:hypothetical protein
MNQTAPLKIIIFQLLIFCISDCLSQDPIANNWIYNSFQTEFFGEKQKNLENTLTKKPVKKSYNHNKYFLSSSAYNLKKGDLQFSNYLLSINELNYGIRDYWSVGAGLLPLHKFLDLPNSSFLKTSFSTKFYRDRTKLSLSILYVFSKFLDDRIKDRSYLTISGAMTFGDHETNITFGFMRFLDDYYYPNTIYSINAKFKLSPGLSFITENNLILTSNFETMSFGGISYSFNRISLDLGTLLPFNRYKTRFNGFYPFFGIKITGNVLKNRSVN